MIQLFKKNNNHNYKILDGQQRIITIFLIFCFLIKNKDDFYDDKRIFSALKKLFIKDLYKPISANNINLKLLSTDYTDLEEFIKYFSDDKLKKENKFCKAYSSIEKEFEENNYDYSNLLKGLNNCNFLFGLIKNENDAPQLFLSLNGEGMQLNFLDIIKGFIYEQIKLNKNFEADKFEEKWNILEIKLYECYKKPLIKISNKFLIDWLNCMYNKSILKNNEIKNSFKCVWNTYFKSKLNDNIYFIMDKFFEYIDKLKIIKNTRKSGIRNELISKIGINLNKYFLISNLLNFTQSDFIWINYLRIQNNVDLKNNSKIDKYLKYFFQLNLIFNINKELPNKIAIYTSKCYKTLSKLLLNYKLCNDKKINIFKEIENNTEELKNRLLEYKPNFKKFKEYVQSSDSKKIKIYSVLIFLIMFSIKNNFFENENLKFKFSWFLDADKSFYKSELNNVLNSIGCIMYFPSLKQFKKDYKNFRDIINKIQYPKYTSRKTLEEIEFEIYKDSSIYKLIKNQNDIEKVDIEKRNNLILKYFENNKKNFKWLFEH